MAPTAKKAPAKKATPTRATLEPVTEPAVAPPPMRAPRSRFAIVMIVAAVLGVLLVGRLGAQERGGPPHTFAAVNDGIPGTLYIPGKLDDGNFPLAPPKGERPALVIVTHGFSADQQIMSTISRSLARAGFAVLAIDYRGHGSNTRPFEGDLTDDIKAALDWADTSPYVDNTRIALLGHSMGAGAVLEAASRDPRVKAVVPVSGGDVIRDQQIPPNVLLIAGSADPKVIRDRQVDMENQLTGKTNVKRVVIDGRNHVTILFSGEAINDTVEWLDTALNVAPPAKGGVQDPRLGTAFLYLLVAAVLLFGAGAATGRLAPIQTSSGAPGSGGVGLIIVAIALLLAMPFMAVASPAGFLPILVGAEQYGLYAVAGGLLFGARWLGVRRLVDSPRWWPEQFGRTLAVAALGVAAAYLLLLPISAIFHRMVPTPERMIIWIVGTALMAPLALAASALIRRGSLARAIGWGVASRVMSLIVLAIGIRLGLLPGVLSLILPILAIIWLLIEVFAAGVYWRSRNVWLIALVEAGWIAWLAAISGPVF